MIYLDHAATCPMRQQALAQMTEALQSIYGNASPSYPAAQQARAKLDGARAALAETIGADWNEIFFTSGGTEADNWALIGAYEARRQLQKGAAKGHIITTQIEHHAVLHTCEYLESRGVSVSYLPAERRGFVQEKALEKELEEHPDTFLVSVMLANNEVGTIEDIAALTAAVRRAEAEVGHRILFHTDAVQAYGKLSMDVKALDADLLSVSAHKLGGPKGIGFLYIRKGTVLGSLMHGGGQESGRRAGTENVPAAIGFAAAAREACGCMQEEQAEERRLQDYFVRRLQELFVLDISGVGAENLAAENAAWHEEIEEIDEIDEIDGEPAADVQEVQRNACNEKIRAVWNGPLPGSGRLAGNVNVSFPGFDQRTLLMNLDLAGVCASGGSACTSGALEPSHVLMALTKDRKAAEGALRFTLGPENTEAEIDEALRILKETLERIKSAS